MKTRSKTSLSSWDSKLTSVKRIVVVSLLLVTPPLVAAAKSANGEDLYTMYCTQCHGTKGDGQGVNAASMSVQPRSHIETAEMSLRSDDELYKVIEQGGASINKSVLMPAWKDNMTAEQIHAVVGHLRELCCKK